MKVIVRIWFNDVQSARCNGAWAMASRIRGLSWPFKNHVVSCNLQVDVVVGWQLSNPDWLLPKSDLTPKRYHLNSQIPTCCGVHYCFIFSLQVASTYSLCFWILEFVMCALRIM
jgi:hypothetical protein